MNLLESYNTYFKGVHPILKDMSRRGIPIDDSRRLELKALIEREDLRVTAEIQRIVPAEVLSTKQAKGLKRTPRDTSGLVEIEVVIEKEEKCQCVKKNRPTCGVCLGAGIVPAGTVLRRWAEPVEFNPNSPKQVKGFMKYLKHPVPKHQKRTDASGEASDTTEMKELERLWIKTKHPIYPLLIEKRQLTKVSGTYVEGWKPSSDGCIHTTYTFQTATWQTSSRAPNVQNGLKHGKSPFQKALASSFNAMQRAKEGRVLINFDFKSFHALTTAHDFNIPDYARLARIDIHSFVTCHYLRRPEMVGLWKRSDAEMGELFDALKKDPVFKFTRDFKAKRCIAEGALVLTDQGLVPIQNVTLAHRVWDGVEWVNHQGVIAQGEREVITYDGLTATPDHKVILEDGSATTLWEAASSMARLHRTGAEGNAIRTRHRDKLEATARQRIHESENEMLNVRRQGERRLFISEIGTWERLPSLRTDEIAASDSSRPPLRCDYFSVPKPSKSEIQGLRGKGDKMSFRLPQWVRAVCGEDAAARFIPWGRNRQDRQRRPLRTGEPSAINTPRADAQSSHYSMGIDAAREGASGEFSVAILIDVDEQTGEKRIVGKRYLSARSRAGADASVQNVESNRKVAGRARTYDIVNAGPRRCFTVSGKLVLNCILGIQFGMGYRKLYQLNRDDFESEGEARNILEMVYSLFPRLRIAQNEVKAKAAEEKRLVSKFGAIRHFYDVQRFDRRMQKWVPGDQAEEAVAFLPASHAFGHFRSFLLKLREGGWDEKFGLCNQIHDSALFHCPLDLAEECIATVKPIMEEPSTVLIYPEMAPNGLSVGADHAMGDCLAECK